MKKGFLARELAIVIAIAVAGIGCGLGFGVAYSQANMKPETQIVEKVIEKPVEVRVEVPVIVEREIKLPPEVIEVEKLVEVEKVFEVEKIIKEPMELRQFENLEQLRLWLGEECHFILFGDFKFGELKCDGYALWLQEQALKDGYLISFQAIYPNIYNGLFHKMRIDRLHAINSVIIGKEFYYIEPQTREVVLGGKLN